MIFLNVLWKKMKQKSVFDDALLKFPKILIIFIWSCFIGYDILTI